MFDHNRAREEYKKKKSKEKLFRVCKTKINTTMIGAIADLEKLNIPDEVFEELRSLILDRGNSQIRQLEIELNNFDVVYRGSFDAMILPVKNKEE